MKKIIFIIMVLAALTLAACGGGGSGAAAPAAVATVPAEFAGLTNPLGGEAAGAGAEVFKNNCESCHGSQGHGDGPAGMALIPKPKDLAVFAPTVTDDYLFWRITTGKPGTAMIAWKGVLTDEQIWQVIGFVRTLK